MEDNTAIEDAILDIDMECAALEDVLHGKEGKRISVIRKKIAALKNQNKADLLPTDEETSKWFDENIGEGCSASSGIYKFRLWLRDRASVSVFEKHLKDGDTEYIGVTFTREL